MTTNAVENLGPAERIINTLLQYTDHGVHNRPGYVIKDASSPVGLQWFPVTHKEENGEKVVYKMVKQGKKNTKVRLGVLKEDGKIKDGRSTVGEYRPAGLFPEVIEWMYARVADVWKLDNEFSARWASYAFGQEHKDLKVVLAAFMLVQSRKGDPILENGKVALYDDDFRDVGEAMLLLQRRDGKDFNPKLLGRIREVLYLPKVVEMNRQLGFGKSQRNQILGRWEKAVEKWLRYREENTKMLEGLVKAGFRTTVMKLANMIWYKPTSTKFYETLRWKQKQSKDGRRTLAIGTEVKAAESWEGLGEKEICEKIIQDKPNFKRISGLLPKGQGITRAIVAAAIEAGSFSEKDLLIYTPTLEELGLLQVSEIKAKWEKAVKRSDDMRASNIATRVKSKAVKEKLDDASDNAMKKAVAEVMKGIVIYFVIDISGSMKISIETAKEYLARFLQGFPLEKLNVAVFSTAGRVVQIRAASKAGVEAAFRGIDAGGGTDHAAGVRALQDKKPGPDEDALMIFVGDEGQSGDFAQAVRASGINPMAFGLIKVPGENGRIVTETATKLGIPCFKIDEKIFADPYAIPRTIRALVAATPVGRAPERAAAVVPRFSLVETILKTEILSKPAWAA